MSDYKPLENILASFTHKDLDSGNQLFKTLSNANISLEDFDAWLQDNKTFNLAKPPEGDRAAFLLKHKIDRERFKSRIVKPCSPCHDKGDEVP